MKTPTRLTLAGLSAGGLVALAIACGDNGTTGGTTPDLATPPPADMAVTPDPDMAVDTTPIVGSLNVTKDLQKGGATVTITGSRFQAGATVKIGTVTATVTNVAADGTSITFTVPANKNTAGAYQNPGIYDVVVTNPDTKTAKLTRAFTYYIETPAFATGVSVAGTDLGPRFVVMGDFDGKNGMDLATVNADANSSGTSDSLTVFLNDGKGVFALQGTRYIVGNYPYSITAADVNNDKILDLIVPNQQSNDLHVLIGNGDGSFKTPKQNPIAGASKPQSVSVADVNNDGKVDLVVTSLADTNDVQVLLGANSDTFGAAQSFSIGKSAYTSVAGDFDGDGKLDVALGHNGMLASNPVSILLNDAKTAAPYFRTSFINAAGQNVFSIAVANFNDAVTATFTGDKYPDLLCVNNGSNSLGLVLGSKNGTFTSAANSLPAGGNGTTINPEGVAAADLNGDGTTDGIVALFNNVVAGAGDIGYLLGDGTGVLKAVAKIGAGNDDPNSVVAGDFNADGRMDLAYTSYRSTGGALVIRLGTGN